jgi:hypothetical protein
MEGTPHSANHYIAILLQGGQYQAFLVPCILGEIEASSDEEFMKAGNKRGE